MKLSKYSLENSQIINSWANMVQLRRLMMQQESVYMDEVFLVATIYRLTNEVNRPITLTEFNKAFNVLSYKRDKMLKRVLEMGFVNNDRIGPLIKNNGFKLIVTSKGEQLLIKYDKALRELAKI